MPIKESLIKELEHEANVTRKFYERYPEGKNDWKPHAKSYTLNVLAAHIAELPTWVGYTLNHSELDFAKLDYKPPVCSTGGDILELYNKNIAQALEDLKNAADETFSEPWTLRMGEKIFFTRPKLAVLRDFVYNHTIHHRAQLGVYYRMLDIPVPPSFGPTADEQF